MRRSGFTLVVLSLVLACGSAEAAPPTVHPELAAWWDDWHDAEGYLLVHNGTNAISYGELWAISVDQNTSPAAVRQAKLILGHWGLWKRRLP